MRQVRATPGRGRRPPAVPVRYTAPIGDVAQWVTVCKCLHTEQIETLPVVYLTILRNRIASQDLIAHRHRGRPVFENVKIESLFTAELSACAVCGPGGSYQIACTPRSGAEGRGGGCSLMTPCSRLFARRPRGRYSLRSRSMEPGVFELPARQRKCAAA